VLLAIDLYEDIIDVESGANTSFSQEVFNVTVAEIESVVEPNGGVTDNMGRESVTLVCIHGPILSISAN
jgi:hypothetical protein